MPLPVTILMSSIILMFIVLGILIKYKKCYWLISGYNTMSKEKKKNVDIVGLSRLMGNFCFVMAGILFIGIVLNYLGMFVAFAFSLGSIFLIVPYLLIKAQKYDNNSRRPDGKLKFSVIAIIGLILLIFAVAVGSIIYGCMKSRVTVNDSYINIDGIYGMNLDINKVSEVSLTESIPKIKRKKNGFDFGNILKGTFELEKIGSAKLYINKGSAPYINIKYGDSCIIINFRDSLKTQSLYDDIKSRID